MVFSNGVIAPVFPRGAWSSWFFWPLLSGLWVIPALSWADETASIAAIAHDWKSRENRTSTLNCEWAAEFMRGANTLWYRDQKGKQVFMSPNDFTTNGEYRFRLQGPHKMRYEYTQPQLVQESRSFEKRWYLSLTDGADQKQFYGKDEASEDPRFAPRGYINEKETLPETATIHLWPLLILYRASIATQFDLTKFSPKGKITIAGREFLLLERTGGGTQKQEVVIDLNRDCVPVRICGLAPDGSKDHGAWLVTSQVEIDYVDQAGGNWRPAGWKTVIMGEGGKVLEQMKAVVKRFDINADIPDSVFQFDFPVGTIVDNYKTKEYYLLREGGVKRRITDAENNARVSYKQLLTTNPGGGRTSDGGAWRVVVLVVCSVLFLLLVISRALYARYKKA
jgi:hypothetical protein